MKEADIREHFEKVRNGDKEAFTYIFNEYKKPVFTVVCRIVGDIQTAEDITQEVFVKLFFSPPDSSVKNTRAWIFKIARNLSIDALRKKQSLSIDDVELTADDTCDEIVLRLDLDVAMKKLTDIQRQVVTLHLNGGLTFSEIAFITGLSLSATFRSYRKALKTLREILDGGAL
ncbi:MAG: RNA polymerase sigma factor [Ruminococcus sp.]|nr:RNA polymerase sigma factor [Ruminococcus sp.]